MIYAASRRQAAGDRLATPSEELRVRRNLRTHENRGQGMQYSSTASCLSHPRRSAGREGTWATEAEIEWIVDPIDGTMNLVTASRILRFHRGRERRASAFVRVIYDRCATNFSRRSADRAPIDGTDESQRGTSWAKACWRRLREEQESIDMPEALPGLRNKARKCARWFGGARSAYWRRTVDAYSSRRESLGHAAGIVLVEEAGAWLTLDQ